MSCASDVHAFGEITEGMIYRLRLARELMSKRDFTRAGDLHSDAVSNWVFREASDWPL